MKIWLGKGQWIQVYQVFEDVEVCTLEIEDKGHDSDNPCSADTVISKEEALRLMEALRQFVKKCNDYAARYGTGGER